MSPSLKARSVAAKPKAAMQRAAKLLKFKSKYEQTVYSHAIDAGYKLAYEPAKAKLKYVLPERAYQPDFVLANGIVVETKGFLRYDDLRKMIAVKAANPQIDLRIVFMRADRPLRKGGQMAYGEWATKAGFLWAEGMIPEAWHQEKAK